MIKTIIATCLLTFSCSSGSLKRFQTPKNAYVGNSYVCTGNYTLQDEFDFTDVLSHWYDYLEPLTLTHTITIDSMNNKDYYHFVSNGSDYETVPLQTLTITFYYASQTVNLYVEDYTDNSGNMFDLKNGEDIDYIDTEAPFNSWVQNFIIGFNTEYYLTGIDSMIFNAIFTKNGNRYTHYYNGYYHFNNGSWLNTTNEFSYTGALFVVENTLLNNYTHNTDEVVFELLKTDRTVTGNVYAYKNSTYYNVSNININGLLPQVVRNTMNTEGVFQFVNDTPPTTWYEMILSTMDAPIYYLKQLLGFELFGMNLFIAFASLLTLVLIITIIKKVV